MCQGDVSHMGVPDVLLVGKHDRVLTTSLSVFLGTTASRAPATTAVTAVYGGAQSPAQKITAGRTVVVGRKIAALCGSAATPAQRLPSQPAAALADREPSPPSPIQS